MRIRLPRPAAIESLESRHLLSTTAGPLAAADAAPLPARQVENLNRGLVVVRKSSTAAYLSWRMLATDPSTIAFNVYRSANNGTAVKLNPTPITATTDYSDGTLNVAASNQYFVRPVINGVEQAPSESYFVPANSPVRQYLSVPLQIPPGGTTPDGVAYTYSANDTSVGDLDGDGDYEFIVKWDPSNAKDNSQSGYTGNVYLDAYQTNGTRLWRIDLGINIRAGAHYTQFMVYDFDGDGKAEVATKTAPGTRDGLGNNVILGSDNPAADYRDHDGSDGRIGYVLSGPEYLTVFNGLTGAAMATTNFLVARGSVSNWGDSYGNRVDRFLGGVAYLDGQRPSLVFGRGYYERTTLSAWDWRNGQLTNRWVFDSEDATPDPTYEGQGTHSLSVADVDGDGRDEIIYGAATFDDNGQPLAVSGLGHGDALHVSDMDPSRPGLEVFQVHEGTGSNGHVGGSLRDAATGQVLVSLPVTQNTDGTWPDVGRGVAMDIDPSPGYEFWTSSHPSIYSVNGTPLYSKGNAFINFGVWWDADLYRELLDGTTIANWTLPGGGRSNYDLDPATSGTQGFAPGASSNNGTKSTPALSGDILGDWREEVIWRTSDNTELRIFTTIISATNRLVTLMHDVQYREAIAWQNTAYNQPPHPSFFLGNGMATPPAPNVYIAGTPPPTGTYPAELGTLAGGTITEATNAGYNGAAYVNFPTTGGSLTFGAIDGGVGGLANLVIRYALGATTSRTGLLTVNDASQPITFDPTGAWTTWNTLTIPVNTEPGTANTVRFDSNGQDLANIDEITLIPTTYGTLSGRSFYDTDADNSVAPSEPGLPGITVYLDTNDNGQIDPTERFTTTNSTGDYTFTNIVPGNYVVRQSNTPADFFLSSPASAAVTSGASVTSADLPNIRIAYTATSADDDYILRRTSVGKYELLISGALAYTLPANIPSLLFNFASGNDTLTLDFASASPLPPGSLSSDAEEMIILNSTTSAVRQAIFSDQLTTPNTDPLRTLGYLDTGSSILVRPTYIGDANLNGRLDSDDQALLDLGLLLSRTTWTFGDFDHDGQVTQTDAILYRQTLAALTPPPPAPTSVALAPTAATTTATAKRAPAAKKPAVKPHKKAKKPKPAPAKRSPFSIKRIGRAASH